MTESIIIRMANGPKKREHQGAKPHWKTGGLTIPPGHLRRARPVFSETPPEALGTFVARVARWVDGDTVHLDTGLAFMGLDATAHPEVRLYGVDTPERGDQGYAEATDYCKMLAPVGATVIVQTYTVPDKYGRLLAEVFTEAGTNISVSLIEAGLGRAYLGGTREPWPDREN